MDPIFKQHYPNTVETRDMSFYWIGGLLACGLFITLVIALFNPEQF